MTSKKTTLKRLAMTAVMMTTAYQGLLVASDFEAAQKAVTLQVPSYSRLAEAARGNSNAAPVYLAAGQLLDGYHLRRRCTVSLKTLAEDRENVVSEVHAAQTALQLLSRGSTMSHCDFGPGEIYGGMQVDFLGLRAVVQAGCLQMMLWAEAGEGSRAVALGKDLAGMIAQVDKSPTVIRHAVSVSLAEQLGKTTRELREAYPTEGFEALANDLSGLAQALDQELLTVPRQQAGADLAQLDGGEGGTWGSRHYDSALPLWSKLAIRNAKLQMLDVAQRTEEALAARDMAALESMMEEVEGRENIATVLTPNWPSFVERHNTVVALLRSFGRSPVGS
jgi:hypothetical protein